MLRTLAALFSLVAHAAALAADGDVDRTFGDDGQVTIRRDTDSPTSRTPTGDVLALADGAYLWSFPNEDASLSIGRTLHDGAPDLAFGDEGTGRITLSTCVDDAPSFLASDGNGGAFAWTGACIVHVLADGTLADDAGGVAIFGDDYYVTDFARDDAGRFVFAATTGQTFDVLRVTADGVTPDASFGDAGHVRVEIAGFTDAAGNPTANMDLARNRAQAVKDALVAETLQSREGLHLFLYPFAGRHAHLGLASLLGWRAANRTPATFSLAFNDYGLELLSATPID